MLKVLIRFPLHGLGCEILQKDQLQVGLEAIINQGLILTAGQQP